MSNPDTSQTPFERIAFSQTDPEFIGLIRERDDRIYQSLMIPSDVMKGQPSRISSDFHTAAFIRLLHKK